MNENFLGKDFAQEFSQILKIKTKQQEIDHHIRIEMKIFTIEST